LVSFRLSKEEIARIDAWGEQRDLSRSDAIRAMITQVLDGERRSKHR
jgi:hypothetical protein